MSPVRLSRASFVAALVALGACSDRGAVVTAPDTHVGAPRASLAAEIPTLVITEIMSDPSKVADAAGEYFEVFNPGTVAVDMNGWRIQSFSGESHTIATSFVVPPCGVAVLANNASSATNGGITGAYSYGTSITLNNSATDWLSLRRADGSLADSVSYSARTAAGALITGGPSYSPSSGVARVLTDPAADNATIGGSSVWIATPTGVTYGPGDRGTPGAISSAHLTAYSAQCGNVQGPGEIVRVGVAPDPLLVRVGGTATLAATAFDAANLQPATTFTWSTANATVATVSTAGVVTGVTEGTTTIRATAANGIVGSATVNVIVPVPTTITIAINTPRVIPVGFTKPSFPTVLDQTGTFIPSPVLTWTTGNTAIATVDDRGYVTGTGAGTTTIVATAANGASGSTTITILPALTATSAVYRDHLEFGTPSDGSANDDQVIPRREFVSSWNAARGVPNWVSWNLNASQFGDADRCDCFSADPATPEPRVVDTDYRNSGYDRGHMVQSESRTVTLQENAATFLFTNIIPQAGSNNQGPWSQFEQHLNAQAQAGGKEIYVISGGEFAADAPSLKGEGRVFIPDYTWKVAVLRPGGAGLAGIGGTDNAIEVIAVRMPNRNETGIPASASAIRSTPWQNFRVTVDQIEALVGYDLLSALPAGVEAALEAGKALPRANAGAGYQAAEGVALQLSGAASTDPDNDIVSYAWNFGDGTTGTGIAPTHTFADDGAYTVTLTVTDALGATSTAKTTVTVANVAPMVGAFGGATLLPGETYSASGSFTDPGTDTFAATVDYGTGTGPQSLALAGTTFTLSKQYDAAGSFTVTVRVNDDDGGAGVRTATVVVLTVEQGLEFLADRIEVLGGSGALNRGEANALAVSLRNAARQVARDGNAPAIGMLGALVNKVDAFTRTDCFTDADATSLTTYANRLIATLSR